MIDKKKEFENYFKMADDSQQEGDFVGALDNIEKCIEIDPENVHCIFSRGIILAELDRSDESLIVFESIIKNYSTEFKDMIHYVYYSMGMIYDEKEAADKAMECFDKCIELNPDFPQAYYQKGVCYFDVEENDKALDLFNKALNLEEHYYEALFARGHVYFEKSEFEKAIQDFSNIINEVEDEFQDSSIFLSRAMCYFEMDEFEKALNDLNTSIELNPEEIEAYDYRAHVHEKLGNTEEFKKDIEKFNELVQQIEF
ncbi:MAG: tetratricopeptide repeat protein [Candidatus Muirbacterium halophilum]|nr:tetratricopeptide repeat protein [Candidatus Muirbacterium halophilum]MCK9476455.1 tetratricopeptide repeat protein [Candidatus Muirbacterium halophilum]